MSGVAMQRSKSIWPPLTIADEILGADDIGARRLGLVGLGAAREHRDAQDAAGAVGQVDDAAHHLVGVFGIDAEIEGEFDRLVEFGGGALFDQLHRFIELVELDAIDGLARLDNSLS